MRIRRVDEELMVVKESQAGKSNLTFIV